MFLNQLILNTSFIDGKLLILGDFNFPTINWDNLSTLHLSNHCTSEFLAACLYHRANYASMKIELQKVDWCKCFIILALLNVGENLNKSLKSNFKIFLLPKADSKQTPNLYG